MVHAPVLLPDAGRDLQLSLREDDDAGGLSFEIHGRGVDAGRDAAWLRHASGRLAAPGPAAPAAAAPLAEIIDALGPARERRGRTTIAWPRSASRSARGSAACNARTSGTARCWRALRCPRARAADAVDWAHPALLDGALQAVGLALPEDHAAGDVHLLAGVDGVHLAGPLPPALWCHARLRAADAANPSEWRADVMLRGDDGAVLGRIGGVRLRRAARESLRRAVGVVAGHGLGYQVVWEPAPLPAAPRLVPPAASIAAVRSGSRRWPAPTALAVYDDLLPELDRLSAEHVVVALRELGFVDTPGRWFSAETEAARPRCRAGAPPPVRAAAADARRGRHACACQGAGFECVAPLGTPRADGAL